MKEGNGTVISKEIQNLQEKLRLTAILFTKMKVYNHEYLLPLNYLSEGAFKYKLTGCSNSDSKKE